MAQLREERVLECVFGDPESATVLVLSGDSHAGQWAPALDSVAAQQRWRVVSMTKTSCPAARVPSYSQRFKREYKECERWRERALRRIKALEPAAVLVSNYSMSAPRGLNPAGTLEPPSWGEWRNGMESTLRSITASGASAVLLIDTPHPGLDVPACLSRIEAAALSAPRGCSASRSNALNDIAIGAERAAVRQVKGASIIDLSDKICDPTACPAVRNGLVVYHDTNHLTASFARSLSGDLADQLVPLLHLANKDQTDHWALH
jgi:hypothetical protein